MYPPLLSNGKGKPMVYESRYCPQSVYMIIQDQIMEGKKLWFVYQSKWCKNLVLENNQL